MERVLCAVILGIFSTGVFAVISENERAALLSIAEFGESYFIKSAWQGEPGTECNWQGIVCDESQMHVVEIDLSGQSIREMPIRMEALSQMRKINLSQAGFDEWPAGLCSILSLVEIDISHNHLSEIHEDCANLKKLKKINLSGNAFEFLPFYIASMSSLEELVLNRNPDFISLPRNFEDLVSLRRIYIGYNQQLDFVDIIDQISQLPNLQSLSLNYSGLEKIPENIGKLAHLKELDLQFNRLASLPDQISALHALRNLNLANNQFSEVPEMLMQLNELHTLNMAGNKIKQFPVDLKNLKNLTDLNLNGNKFNNIPVEIANFTSLKALSLGGNSLTDIPAQIGQLKSLEELYLSGNKLSGFPAEFFLLNLSVLELQGNQLLNFPVGFTNYKGLSELNLGGNHLMELPPEIGRLTGLLVLNLENNRLVELPDEIGNLTNLTELTVENNRITQLPKQFGQLRSLSKLILVNNQLTELNAEFGGLTSLMDLQLQSNQLTGLPPEFGKLVLLEELNLSDNQIEAVPSEFGQLGRLVNLNLNTNKLARLPATIGNLKALKNLDLGRNQLIELPVELFSLTSLEKLNLYRNRLTEIDASIENMTGLSRLILSENFLSDLPVEIVSLNMLAGFSFTFQSESYPFLLLNENCMEKYFETDAQLSEEQQRVAEWLNETLEQQLKYHIFGYLNNSQRSICAEIQYINEGLMVQNQPEGQWANFIFYPGTGKNSIHAGFLDGFEYQLHSVWPNIPLNISGQVAKVANGVWRIPTTNLAPGKYQILFSHSDPFSVAGLAAWSVYFNVLPAEPLIVPGFDFSEQLNFLYTGELPWSNSMLNLDFPVFEHDLAPYRQIQTIPGIQSVRQEPGFLRIETEDVSLALRPFRMEKSATAEASLTATDEHTYSLQTSLGRRIKAAPALVSPNDFTAQLESNHLFLERTEKNGLMKIVTEDPEVEYFYSAQADAEYRASADVEGPGLYLRDVPGLPNVKIAQYVYYDEQKVLTHQTVPPRMYDWDGFKRALDLNGFTEITMSKDGVLSTTKDQQRYTGYADYRVDPFVAGNSQPVFRNEILVDEDYNGDGILDALYQFSEFGTKYTQKVFLFPSN